MCFIWLADLFGHQKNSMLWFRVVLRVGMPACLAHLKLSRTVLSWSVNSCVYNSVFLLTLFAGVLVNVGISLVLQRESSLKTQLGFCGVEHHSRRQRTAGVDLLQFSFFPVAVQMGLWMKRHWNRVTALMTNSKQRQVGIEFKIKRSVCRLDFIF